MIKNELKNCFVNITKEDKLFIEKVLDSDVISGKSPVVLDFEKKLCNYFNTDFAVTCSNGTLAIWMSLFVFGVGEGDEVMLPPTAPIMSVLPILALKAKPVFIDLKSTDNFDLLIEDIEKKITFKTKVIINVPMWGYSNNSYELLDVCKKNNLFLLEDLSHCHGTKLKNGEIMGGVGDISIFSTHERKMITTGEGGFLLTNKINFYNDLLNLRSFGTGYNSYEYGKIFGLNFRLSGINASLGITQLNKIDEKIKKRTNNANYLLSKLNLFNVKEVISEGVPNYYALALVFNEKNKNYSKNFSEYLNENKIISDTYAYKYKPLYEMDILKEYKNECNIAEKMINSIITLPTHEGLSFDELDYIVDIFNKFNK